MAKFVESIETERLFLEGIDAESATEIVTWRSNPDVYRFFKNPHQLTIEEHLNWFQNIYLCSEDRADWICIEKSTGNKIGVFGLIRKEDEAEVNYILDPKDQHKGYASECVKRLVLFAKEHWKSNAIIAEIHKENVPSIALVKKLGFKHFSSVDDFVRYRL